MENMEDVTANMAVVAAGLEILDLLGIFANVPIEERGLAKDTLKTPASNIKIICAA
jgi:hypothetical protein